MFLQTCHGKRNNITEYSFKNILHKPVLIFFTESPIQRLSVKQVVFKNPSPVGEGKNFNDLKIRVMLCHYLGMMPGQLLGIKPRYHHLFLLKNNRSLYELPCESDKKPSISSTINRAPREFR